MRASKRVPSKVSEVKLTYANKIKACDRIKVLCAKDASIVLKKSWDYDTIDGFETFKAMYLNRANQVLGIVTISTGGIAAALVDPVKVFCGAIKCFATGIILCHNHPSGSLTPSESDKKLTFRMKEAGNILGIHILDHIIISREEYRSMADKGDM